MTEDDRRELAAVAAAFRMPRYRELPDIGLRLEQVTRYVARYAPGPLTGSMVSNYVKQRLIPGPSKKAYSQESIAYLLILSYIKTVMSLEDIRLMEEVQLRSYDIAVAYDYFCDEFENMLGAAFGIAPAREGLGETKSDAKDLLRNTISATVNKVYLDRFLEEYQRRREKESPGAQQKSRK